MHFSEQGDENLGLVGLFSDNQSKNMLQICKTVSDDTRRILRPVGVICLPAHGKLQCQLILDHHRENSRYMHIDPTDESWVSSQHTAKGDSSCGNYDHNVLQKS